MIFQSSQTHYQAWKTYSQNFHFSLLLYCLFWIFRFQALDLKPVQFSSNFLLNTRVSDLCCITYLTERFFMTLQDYLKLPNFNQSLDGKLRKRNIGLLVNCCAAIWWEIDDFKRFKWLSNWISVKKDLSHERISINWPNNTECRKNVGI